jgi:hypothetical protein
MILHALGGLGETAGERRMVIGCPGDDRNVCPLGGEPFRNGCADSSARTRDDDAPPSETTAH